MEKIYTAIYWATAALAGYVFALLIAWYGVSGLNFFYSTFYEYVGVGENIVEYGPLNRNRSGFENTTKLEHERLMSELVRAINNNGEGLREIQYFDNEGRALDSLLTEPEVIHLQDVAKLVSRFNVAGWLAAALLVAMIVIALRLRLSVPGLAKLVVYTIGSIVVLGLGVLIIGPVKVFYWLHEWIFPAKNQWFFYYEDSLMTTMLKAPVIFGPIAVAWLLIATVLWLVVFYSILRISSKLGDNRRY